MSTIDVSSAMPNSAKCINPIPGAYQKKKLAYQNFKLNWPLGNIWMKDEYTWTSKLPASSTDCIYNTLYWRFFQIYTKLLLSGTTM